MDWSKAKTILIVAFLVTNILLASLVIYNKKQVPPTLSDEFVLEVAKMLGEKNISLDTTIPRTEEGLVPLTVRYESLNPEDINEKLYGGQGKIETNNNETTISGLTSQVQLRNNKIFTYTNEDKLVRYKNLDEEMAVKIADKFIRELNFQREDMDISYIFKDGDSYKITYSKKYEDIYVERAYIDLIISPVGVETCTRIWLDLKLKGDVKIYTSTAPKAILSFLSMEEVYGKTIVDISMCYFFDPNQHEYVETFENAKEGKTVPAWRVLFSDGSRIMLDNY